MPAETPATIDDAKAELAVLTSWFQDLMQRQALAQQHECRAAFLRGFLAANEAVPTDSPLLGPPEDPDV